MKIIRWVLCLPVGMATGVLVFFFFKLLGGRHIEPGSITAFLDALLGGGLSGSAAVYVSCYVAPTHRKYVALVLVLLTAIGSILAYPIMFEKRDWAYFLFTLAQDSGMVFITYKICKGQIGFGASNNTLPPTGHSGRSRGSVE